MFDFKLIKCFLLELYFLKKQLVLSICKTYCIENQKCLQNFCLQNYFAVNKIRFPICEVQSENSFPGITADELRNVFQFKNTYAHSILNLVADMCTSFIVYFKHVFIH